MSKGLLHLVSFEQIHLRKPADQHVVPYCHVQH